MDDFITAYNMGKRKAALDFEKEASAKDVAAVLSQLGSGAKDTGSLLKKLLAAGGEKAVDAAKATKYLGTISDPRVAGMVGGGGALTSTLLSGNIADKLTGLGVNEALAHSTPAALAALGGALALGANPGLLGGSRVNRITHELAQTARTPAGMIGTMAGVVGLPAALIGYGKMKGKEEASFF